MICNALIWDGRVAKALPEHHQDREKEFVGHTDLKEKNNFLVTLWHTYTDSLHMY